MSTAKLIALIKSISVAAAGGGAFAPDITDPQDGDTLVYNAEQQKWVNGTGSGSGGTLILHMVLDEGQELPRLDRTWQEIHDTLVNGYYVCIAVSDEDDAEQYRINSVGVNEFGVYSVFTAPQSLGNDGLNFETNNKNAYPIIVPRD